MRKKSIDILIEISARCHEVCSYIGGFKIIIDSLIDLSADKIRYDYLISSILNVINTPENRRSFRDGTELTRIFSIFTVAEVNKKEIDEKTLSMMESKYFMAKQVILAMIRHWTGLLYLAADPTGIKSLVEALTQPILEVKKVAILDLFIEIFSQKIDNDPAAMMKSQDSILSYKQKIGTLVSNYMSFVLLAFIEGNLYDVLIELILSESSYKILGRAKFLLKRIMQMAFKILPNHPHLPFLIETATDFSVKSDEFTRSSVSKIIKELSEIPTLELANPFKRIKSNDEAADGAENYEVNDIAKETIVEFHDQRKVFFTCMEYYMHHPIGVPSSNEYLTPYSELKVLFSSDLDNRFRKKLNSTNVNNNKDYRQWKWDVILQLFESNILGDERILEEALKNKFMKRLLKFYLPMKKDFVTLEYSSENFIFAKVGYHLIKVLINSKVGRKVLASAQNINLVFGIGFQDSHDNIFKDATGFMQEIGELLTNEHKILSSILSKKPEEFERKEKEREFGKERLNKTMMREFISWIGLFTTKIDGIRLLQRKNIFHTLKLLIDPSGINDTFGQIIIRSFDYRIDSDQRILLVEWLAKGSKHIKLEILEVFRTLYRSGASDFATWGLPILINYSFAGISEGNEARYCHPDVKTKALSILKEVIEDPVILDDIVNLPYFDHKHFDDDTFLIKGLSHPTALHNLHESGWIDQTLRKWKDSENLKFVKQVTTLLNEELIKGSTDFSESYSLVISNPVISLSEDLRNDAVMLKRFPFNLVVAIENSRSKTLFEEYIQSAIVVDPSGLTITGNTENSIKFLTPLCVANSGNKTKSLMEEGKEVYDDIYNVKVGLMIGKSYIDFKGQDIDLPYWINCDANTIKRKGETYRHPNVAKRMMLRVKKSGCMFIFEKINENKLLLQEIKMKIKFLPDKYQGKCMAPNFYAELAKTPESIRILRDSKQVEEFKKQLTDEKTSIMIKKSLLWTFGMIGTTDYGVELIEEHEIIEEIVQIAENSTYLSVKGTALFALSMICRGERGKEILKTYKWYRADSQGIVGLPVDHSKIFAKIENNFEAGIGHFKEKWDMISKSKKKYNLSKSEEEVLTSIVKLGSSLKSTEGEKEVKYAMTLNPELFSKPHMVHMICNILSIYKFKYNIRKRILQLVDKSIRNNELDEDWEFYL